MIKCVKGEVELEGTTQELVAETMTILNAMNTILKKDKVFSSMGKDITMLQLALIMDVKAEHSPNYTKYPEPLKEDKLNGNS